MFFAKRYHSAYIRAWLLLSICAFALPICAIAQNLAFDHLNVENGLSQNSVMAITQDDRGFLWFGTRYGLNRYDGRTFKLYKKDPSNKSSLIGNTISVLYPDSHHTFWVGTQSGLNRYDRESDSFQYATGDLTLTPTRNIIVSAIDEDSNGTLWVGTWDGLYQLADPATNRFKRFTLPNHLQLAGNNVRAIYQDYLGAMWIGTTTGLTRLEQKNGTYTIKTFRHDPSQSSSISNSFVTNVIEDHQHNLWIGTQNGGLNLYQPATETFLNFGYSNNNPNGIISNDIRKIMVDQTGKLWLGTLEGLSIFDPERRTFTSYHHDPDNKKSLDQNSIYSIFQDVNHTVWIGTYYGGVNITYPYTTAFTTYQNNKYGTGLSSNVVSSIAESADHNLWIGTEGGGLNYFDRKHNSFTSYQNKPADTSSLGSNLIKVVYKDHDGNIWIGTHGGGLNLFDAAHQNFKHYLYKKDDDATKVSEISSIAQDTHGDLWVGTQTGLKILKHYGQNWVPSITKILPGKMATQSVKYLFKDVQGDIWIGTTNGVFLFKNNAEQFTSFINNNRLNSGTVNCITQDSKGNIWVAINYTGLVMYNIKTNHSVIYTEKDGLPNNNAIGIVEDDQHDLWISTDNGLSRFDPEHQKFKNYTTSDGLTGNEFNYNSYFKTSSGELFFGGYNGLVSFYPNKIETNNYQAPVVFSALRLFNEPVEINGPDGLLKQDIGLSKSITFNYDQNVFAIDFALLNYIKSNKNKYAYKLVPFDRDWNYVNIATASYTNIAAGKYTLLVKGANNDGVWSEPAGLQIIVLPPFWKTWIAYLLYISLVAAIVFFVARFFFLRALLKREHELNQLKLNFFTNISHEIRTHLSLIAGPVEKLILNSNDDAPDTRQLKVIKKNSDSLLQLVNELMDFRKAETGNLTLHISNQNLNELLDAVYFSFQTLAASRHIQTEFISSINNIDLFFDPEQLEKVFFNLLSNAFKFTPDGGHITLSVIEKRSSVEIKVTDNGKGIAPENLEKLFDNYFQEDDQGTQNTGYGIGLALSKSIVEQHQGTLTANSEILDNHERQTCFTVTLLKGNKHIKPAQLISAGTMRNPINLSDPQPTFPANIEPVALPQQGHTLLLVEDNPEVRSFLKESLQQQYQILEGVNGANGLDIAREQIPDLIISDVMMPEMNGLELCHELKSDERTSHIPVILLTAKTSTENHVSGLEMGADIYLTKPFSIQVLELQIQNLLTSRETLKKRFSQQVTLQPQNIVVNTVDEKFLQKLMQYVEDQIDDPEFSVTTLSENIGMSKPVLYKKLKAVTNLSVNDFIKSIRLKKAAMLLQGNKYTVYEAAYAVGFNDMKHFRQEFKKQFGVNPGEYAKTDPSLN